MKTDVNFFFEENFNPFSSFLLLVIIPITIITNLRLMKTFFAGSLPGHRWKFCIILDASGDCIKGIKSARNVE